MTVIEFNNNSRFEVEQRAEGVFINGVKFDGSTAQKSEFRMEVAIGTNTHIVDVLNLDLEAGTITVRVNGKKAVCKITTPSHTLLKKIGKEGSSAQKLKVLKSPMPGLVRRITVAPGQAVTKGDPLLVLEAMKMENILKSPGEGVVKQIVVTEGTAVEKNVPLIHFE